MRYLRVLFILLVLAAAGFGVFRLLHHPYFSVDQVEIKGGGYLSDAQKQVHRDSLLGRSILYTFSDDLVATFMAYGVLSQVEIDRVFPRQVHIFLTDKMPEFGCFSEGKSFLIAADGTILNRFSDQSIAQSEDFLFFNGIALSEFEGESLNPGLLSKLLTLNSLVSQHFEDVEPQLEQRPGMGWVFLLHDTIPVYLGTLDHLDQKFTKLSAFLHQYESQKKKRPIKYVDARIQHRILVNYGK